MLSGVSQRDVLITHVPAAFWAFYLTDAAWLLWHRTTHLFSGDTVRGQLCVYGGRGTGTKLAQGPPSVLLLFRLPPGPECVDDRASRVCPSCQHGFLLLPWSVAAPNLMGHSEARGTDRRADSAPGRQGRLCGTQVREEQRQGRPQASLRALRLWTPWPPPASASVGTAAETAAPSSRARPRGPGTPSLCHASRRC